MIKAAHRSAIVADHTKFGTRRLASFARAEDVDHVITTAQCPPEVRSWLEGVGVRLTLCIPSSEGP
jgi:DeoR/GlpR family transcriptional regulator of sugar metabolism